MPELCALVLEKIAENTMVVDSQSVPWGTTGVNTPSSWVPVMCGSYSDQYRGLVQYSFNLIYKDGTVGCAFTHTLAK